jgi:hypothetical protein
MQLPHGYLLTLHDTLPVSWGWLPSLSSGCCLRKKGVFAQNQRVTLQASQCRHMAAALAGTFHSKHELRPSYRAPLPSHLHSVLN